MNTSFWESNLFQTLVLIVTIGATIGIALWQFYAHKRKELRNAVSILLLQINDIEKNIEYILSEGLINGCTETGTEETSERCGNQKTDTQALPDWRCGGIGAGFYD